MYKDISKIKELEVTKNLLSGNFQNFPMDWVACFVALSYLYASLMIFREWNECNILTQIYVASIYESCLY